MRPHGAPRPSVRRQPARAVGEDVVAAVYAAAGNDDARFVGAVVVGNGGVDGDHDAEEVGGIGDALEDLPLPESAFDVVQELGVDLLSAQAGALVAGGDALKEGLGKVGPVLVGGAAGDVAVEGEASSSRMRRTGRGVVVTTVRGGWPMRRPNWSMSQASG